MNSPPAWSKRARAAETLAICISERMPSCIRAPPPEPEMMISGSCCSVARSMVRVSFSPTTEPMLPMMNAESVTPKATRRPRIMPRAHDGRVAQPGALLLLLEPLGVGLLVDEVQRIGRLEVGVPLLEGAFVEHLADALLGRDVPVVIALGADAQPLFGLLAEDRLLAAGASLPQPLGHAALGAFHAGLSRSRFTRFAGGHGRSLR